MEQRSFGVVPVYRDGGELKFLVVRHNVGHWAFPKGHPEAHETERESALRELREETGITKVELAQDWESLERYQFKGSGKGGIIHKTVKYFLGWVGDPAVKILEDELRDYRWANAREASKLITWLAGRKVLAEALVYLKQSSAPA